MSDAVLVLGGGMTGLRAAVELAEGGARAILVERQPIVGGKRAALLFGPDCPDPRLPGIADSSAIALHTQAELVGLSGEPGAFVASVREQPRYVTDDCTRCNHCVPVCPEVAPNEFDSGLTFRKAIHSPLPQTLPDIYSIDIDTCLNSPPNYLPCQRCAEVCDDDAIHFDRPAPAPTEHEVAAVVVATGFAGAAERELLAEFGHGDHPDILSADEMQRLLEDPGPSGGFAVRPSDESYPGSVLLVLTAISEDAAWVLGNHLRRLAAQDIERLDVLVLSAPAQDPLLDELAASARDCGAGWHWGSWIGCAADDAGTLTTVFSTLPAGSRMALASELVSLYTGVRPDDTTAALADRLGLARDERGYLSPRPGIYLAGGAGGTVGVERGAEQALAAVEASLAHVTVSAEPTSEATGKPATTALRQEDVEQLLHTLLALGEGAAP